jgi:DNA-binding winged helix-turn-helix (wHTH) protein
MRIQFEDCQFDPDAREVSRCGRPVPLSPKAFQLLEILIRERPRALEHRKLHAELWPEIFVTDANPHRSRSCGGCSDRGRQASSLRRSSGSS